MTIHTPRSRRAVGRRLDRINALRGALKKLLRQFDLRALSVKRETPEAEENHE